MASRAAKKIYLYQDIYIKKIARKFNLTDIPPQLPRARFEHFKRLLGLIDLNTISLVHDASN